MNETDAKAWIESIIDQAATYKRLYKAAERERDEARQELRAVLERERAELIEWSARVDEQFNLRQQNESELRAANAALAQRVRELTAEVARLQEQRIHNNTVMLDAAKEIRESHEKIKQLEGEINYLRSTDHAADLAFERMAPLDLRSDYDAETPLGHALEESGEVDG